MADPEGIGKIVELIKKKEPGLFQGSQADQNAMIERVRKVLSDYGVEEVLATGVLALMERRKRGRSNVLVG